MAQQDEDEIEVAADEMPKEGENKENKTDKKPDTNKDKYGQDEQNLPPTKKYLPKPRKIYIPYVLPWEMTPTRETQKGMIAFGTTRKSITKINDGRHLLVQGNVHTDTVLTKFAETNIYASQTGITSFGAHRIQKLHVASSKPFEHIHASDGIIPLQAGRPNAPSQSGETPIGSLRLQVPKIKYQANMSSTYCPQSATFISRQMLPNPNSHAGSGLLDRRRPQIPDRVVEPPARGYVKKTFHENRSEAVIPRLWDIRSEDVPAVPALGQFRQVTMGVVSGEILATEEEIRMSKRAVPWANHPILATQQGTGGFYKSRDPVNYLNPMRIVIKKW